MLTYELVVETEPQTHVVRLRLRDQDGVHRGYQEIRLSEHGAAQWEGLFDTRQYVARYQRALRTEEDRLRTGDELLEEIGVFLGQQVLGEEIMRELCRTIQRRTLLVRLPDGEHDVLAAAFARVPWEIARPAKGQKPLMARALVMRAVTQSTSAGDPMVRRAAQRVVEEHEEARVLVVFAEAPGSRPLAMRLERERLRALFEEEILPYRRVRIEILCHGVTREVLRERISKRQGFHIVHWSGHGHHDRLEILGEDGKPSSITGRELVELFLEAGGFVPQLFFLSACLSGAFVEQRHWAALQTALDEEPASDDEVKQAQRSLDEVLAPEGKVGYTGTALAFLRAGVPQVVAMRYSVGDAYARELAWWFYRHLLADEGLHPTEGALALARGDVLREGSTAAQRMPVDHANAVVFGQEGRPVPIVEERSDQMDELWPQPQPLLRGGSRELERPDLFVGRGHALKSINHAWQAGGAAITVVQGLAGLGKTSLVAEAVHLWFRRFAWVLAFQAKPGELMVEDFLRQLDLRLDLDSAAYQRRCNKAPSQRVYLEPGGSLSNDQRYERMRDNLVVALRAEAVLLVLDNFESNLSGRASEGGHACRDPQWDTLLERLARELPRTRSRVVMTTRHRPRALAGEGTLWLPLGPLSGEEALLYVRSHERLAELLEEEEGRALVQRMLGVSRGHPLILDRLAALVGDREALEQALVKLGQQGGLSTLPDLAKVSSKEDVEREREYLEDVAKGSVDLLLERVSAGARRLLWVVTLAFEAVSEGMLAEVWAVERVAVEPLLRELFQAGLVSREESVTAKGDGEAEQANVGFHELVRERVVAWMEQHPEERGPRTAEQVWVGYGQRYAAVFEGLLGSGKPRAREAAVEAGRRALVYLVRAGDFEGLMSFASRLVTSTRDPTLLGGIVAELRAVAEQVPAGQARWHVRTYLADALRKSGQPDEALPLYDQAADEAEHAEHWNDVAWVCGNWANALGAVGQLDASKATRLRSAEADRKAGRWLVNVVGSELEALRIDVMQGHAAQALSAIEARLEQVRGWWKAHAEGKLVPEAPDRDVLGRALVSGLDIACEANRALERWQGCLDLLAETEQVKKERGESEHERAGTRFNTYFPLLRLGRLEEAQRVVEDGLTEFRTAGDATGESAALSALAHLWDERGDHRQAADLQRNALAVRNRLPDPAARAVSHNNLAITLARSGQADAPAHHLAAFAYRLVSGEYESIPRLVLNLAVFKRQATAAGRTYDLPRLTDTLARPAFDALRRFLTTHAVDLPALQAAIDQLEAQAAQG